MNEIELLNQIKPLIGDDETSDDCAGFDLGNGKILVSSTDMLHETTDFPKGMTDFEMGWMSAAVTLSDIASCGAKPIQILAAVGLDKPERLYEIMRGACSCAEKYGAKVSGGDIDSHSELTIVSTGFGIVEKKNYLRRFGASAGDEVCITKIPGRAQAALDGYEKYREFLITPKPDVYEGQKIAESKATAMMDVSDGLALSLYYLAEVNGVGIELDLSTAEFPDVDFDKRLEYFLYGGGDFGLLFCKPQAGLSNLDIDFTVIGKIVEGDGVWLGSEKIEKKGYSHF